MQAISTLKEFCMKRILSVLAIKIYEDGVENGSSLTHKGWRRFAERNETRNSA